MAARAIWLATWLAAHVSTAVAGRLAARLWFTPWPVRGSAASAQRERAWLAATRPLRVPFGGGYLSGFVAGDGPTVLLVHGWGDRGARLGAFIAPLTAAGFRVVGVDLPAHGDSPGRQTDAYDVAAALRVTAAHVGGADAVIAHSMGGLGAAVALRDGLLVQSAVLLAPAVRLDHALQRFAGTLRLPRRAVLGLRREIERRFGTAVWEEAATGNMVRGLDIRALIVHDRDDEQVAFDDAVSLAEAWPAASLVATRGLGHHRLLRDGDVIDRVTSFLASQPPGREPAGGMVSEPAPAG